MKITTNTFFPYLKGSWKIIRIMDFLSNNYIPNIINSGKAIIAQEKENILCHQEKLDLSNPKCKMISYRYYNYIFTKNNVALYKKISEKIEFMFNLKFENNIAHGEYLCNQDLYKATYNFIDQNNFKIVFDILGPEKNYSITSYFSRMEENNINLSGIDLLNHID